MRFLFNQYNSWDKFEKYFNYRIGYNLYFQQKIFPGFCYPFEVKIQKSDSLHSFAMISGSKLKL
jgi:hypothetical protein